MSGSNGYVELAAASNFSFLRGASHAEELVVRARELELDGLAITDRNSVAGVVRGHMAAKEAGLRFAPGCRLVFMDGTPDIFVWPERRQAWGNLCELLSLGKRRAPKGECHLALEDLMSHGGGLLMAAYPDPNQPVNIKQHLQQLKEAFGGYLHLGLTRTYCQTDQRQMAAIARLSAKTGIPYVTLGNIFYHKPERRPLQDVITCIREKETFATIGTRLGVNAERHLRSPGETLRLFAGYEDAVYRTGELFNRIGFSLNELQYQYPDDPVFEELDNEKLPAQKALERLTAIGLERRYPNGAPEKVLKQITHETTLIKSWAMRPIFSRFMTSSASPAARISCVRDAARLPIPQSAIVSALPKSIREGWICFLNASSLRSAMNPPTLTLISSMSAVRK